jgi:hypothetical protein
MKSDQVQRRSKERLKDTGFTSLGDTWPVADLCGLPDSVETEEDLLALALAHLRVSPVARMMIKEAGEQGWRLGLGHLESHDFHLDVPSKRIILDNQGHKPAGLMASSYFYHSFLISLVRSLRDVWQEKRHGGFDENYSPESVLLLERIRAADCDVITVLVAWELRGENSSELWRYIIGSEEGDIALAFSDTLERDPSAAFSTRALAAAFKQWFRNISRVNTCDHEALEYMDDVLYTNPGAAFGKKRAGKICVEVLSCLPDKTAYLRGMGDDILRDPLFAGLVDPINQTHFMHVMRDAQAVYVQNVPFRDAKLAAKIFPGGQMTPERENVIHRN